jgi:hypothetical protein
MMRHAMLSALITGKTRVKLLLRFFLNPDASSYLREIASEFNESTNSIRIELKRFAEAGLLTERERGGRVYYCANRQHPLFAEIHSIVHKTLGIDTLLEELVAKIGSLSRAYLVGDYAKGVDGGLIDLVLVGTKIDMGYLHSLVGRVERRIDRKIRYLVLDDVEEEQVMLRLSSQPRLLLWSRDGRRRPLNARAGAGARSAPT